MEERIPTNVTDEERWIAKQRVCEARVEYRQTGTDTAETYIHLTDLGGAKVCWKDSTFRKVARFDLSWGALVQPAYGVAERVKAREEWEAKNMRDLAEYKRLRAKFGEAK